MGVVRWTLEGAGMEPPRAAVSPEQNLPAGRAYPRHEFTEVYYLN